MFTGIIEGVGIIKTVSRKDKLVQFEINCNFDLERTNVGDSISVNGCCLTITSRLGNTIWVDTTPETLEKSSLNSLKAGDPVNLERAMVMGGRLDGHIVQGHVDGVGKVIAIIDKGEAKEVEIEFPSNLAKYIVEKGSVAIDGISLTVNACKRNRFKVMIIPHTRLRTTFERLFVGREVNLEVDIIGKYVEKLTFLDSKDMEKPSPITEEFLRQHGFDEEES